MRHYRQFPLPPPLGLPSQEGALFWRAELAKVVADSLHYPTAEVDDDAATAMCRRLCQQEMPKLPTATMGAEAMATVVTVAATVRFAATIFGLYAA